MSDAAASKIWPATICRRSRNAAAASLHAPPASTSTAGEGSPAIRGMVGVAGDDTDLCRRKADLVSEQLRQRRPQPLTVRRTADPGLEEARRIHHQFDPLVARRDHHAPRRKSGRAGAGALSEDRHPEAEPAAIKARLLLSLAELRDVDNPRR